MTVTVVLLFAAGGVAAMVQAVTGSGFGLVAAPLVVLLAPELLPGPLLVVTAGLMAVAVFVGARNGGSLEKQDRAELWPAAAGIISGVIITIPVLGWLSMHEELVTRVIAVGVMVTVIPLMIPRRWLVPKGMASNRGKASNRPVVMGIAGIVSGVLTVAAALPGPPLILSYSARDAIRYRVSLAFLFLVASLAALATLSLTVGIAPAGWSGVTALITGVATGFGLGFLIARKVPHRSVVFWSRVTVLGAALALLVP